MTHFIVEYREIGSRDARAAHRAAHIAYRKELGMALPLAGSLLDLAGASVGSLVIIEAADRAEAERIALADPFGEAKILDLLSVRPYRIAAIKLPPGGP